MTLSRNVSLPTLIVVAIVISAPSGALCQNAGVFDAFVDSTESRRAELITIRHDIHQNPEISGAEKRTSELIATKLKILGWTVRERVGGYGVMATLRGAKPGNRVVAFRADMDAVRSRDRDPVEYRSLTPGVRHICGHDVHATIGLALAEGFSAIRSQFGGTIMLLFQPAEETATGANAMLQDGVFETTKPDAIFAVHTAPFQTGQVATTPGGLMGSRDRLTVTIESSEDVDSIAQEARRIVDAHSTVPRDQSFSSVSRESIYIQSQSAARAGEDTRVVRSTVMLADATVRESLVHSLRESLSLLNSEQANVTVEYNRWIYGVTNDVALTTRAMEVAENVLGSGNVIQVTQFVPAFSEDFGSFQELAPGTMFFLGVSNEAKGWRGMPHSPDYVADDEAIFVGARTMAAVILDALDPK